ncbi:MAG TPA: amidohydrolase family protein [Trebonia sp.]
MDVIVDGNVHLAGAAGGAALDAWRSDWPDGQTLTARAYEKAMAAAGVARAVLTTTVRRDGFDNSYTAAAAARDPHRFAYVGNFDVLAPGAPAVIEEQARRFAMAGARFYGGTADDAAAWLDDDRAAAAWGAAARLGLAVSAQRTRAGVLGPLRAMAGKFPGVPVVVHSAADPALGAGGPSEADEVCALARRPNVLVMLASKNISAVGDTAARDFLERLVGTFGPNRVMWGSYAQFAGARLPGAAPSLGDLVANIRERLSFLSPEDLSWVLGGTAERTFWPVPAAVRQPEIERSC